MDIAVSPVSPRKSRTSHLSEAEFRKLRLLSALGEEELAMLARAASLEAHGRRSVIYAAGNPCNSIYFLASGRVKVFMMDAEGTEMILRIHGPGDVFGELCLVDECPSMASVSTLDACELFRIAKDDFARCLESNSDMAMTVMHELLRRLREAEVLIGSLGLEDVIGRVLHLLQHAAEIVNGEKVVRKKLSQREIARRIGASRETVSRALKRLRLQGKVTVTGDSVIIRDDMLPSSS